MDDQIDIGKLWEGLTPDQRNEIAELAVQDGRAWNLSEPSNDIWQGLSIDQRENMAEYAIGAGLAYYECEETHFELTDDGPECPPEFVNIALFVLNNGDNLTKIDLARIGEIGGDWNRAYEHALNLHTSSKRK